MFDSASSTTLYLISDMRKRERGARQRGQQTGVKVRQKAPGAHKAKGAAAAVAAAAAHGALRSGGRE